MQRMRHMRALLPHHRHFRKRQKSRPKQRQMHRLRPVRLPVRQKQHRDVPQRKDGVPAGVKEVRSTDKGMSPVFFIMRFKSTGIEA